LKISSRQLWASLNNVSERGLSFLSQLSYKHFEGHFIIIQPFSNDPSMLESFPLY